MIANTPLPRHWQLIGLLITSICVISLVGAPYFAQANSMPNKAPGGLPQPLMIATPTSVRSPFKALPGTMGLAVTSGERHSCSIDMMNNVQCWGRTNNRQTTPPHDLGSVIKVEAGQNHTCAIQTSGGVRCWGSREENALDIPATLGAALDLTSGRLHTCALRASDRHAICWGSNARGQFMPDDTAYSVLSAGSFYTCGIRLNDSKLECRGLPGAITSSKNFPPEVQQNAVLGLGTNEDHICAIVAPTRKVKCLGTGEQASETLHAKQLTAGKNLMCAITETDTVQCWDEGTAALGAPPAMLNDIGVQQIEIHPDGWHACAVSLENSIVCWGNNQHGQVDPPTSALRLHGLSAGNTFTCGITSEDEVLCWGINTYGQSSGIRGLANVKEVSAGHQHACAVTQDNVPVCWGNNADDRAKIPTKLSSAKSIKAGGRHTCGITLEDTVVCWGFNKDGQTTVPPEVQTVTSISVGEFHTCAITTAGFVECWGHDSTGQIDVPTELQTTERVLQVEAARDFTCALLASTGGVRCWGQNDFDQASPPATLKALSISLGDKHGCAIQDIDLVYCWGFETENGAYQSIVPGRIGPVIDMTAGYNHTCAVQPANEVYCWGLSNLTDPPMVPSTPTVTITPTPTLTPSPTGSPTPGRVYWHLYFSMFHR